MYLKEIKNIFHVELDPLFPKEEVDSFFYLVIEHYLKLERFVLVWQPDLIVTKEEADLLFGALTELRKERPIQYILGTAHFCGLDFKVNKNVLIPRPETEELVYWILEEIKAPDFLQRQGSSPVRILDIGTGSGCIAVSLAKNLPTARVTALDISVGALQVAGENARKNGVDVTYIEADALNLEHFKGKYDIIVSNPPYVRELEKQVMDNNVLKYEPSLALFVSDADPLLFYRSISRFARARLAKGGLLFFEINRDLGNETLKLMTDTGFSEMELKKDMFGNDRMLKGRRK